MSIDFTGLAADLLAHADTLLPEWFPEGKREGHEWCVGSLNGEAGKSLKINMRTGVWKDFAGSDGGADLISLYARSRGIGNGEAAKQLGADVTPAPLPPAAPKRKPAVIDASAERPPADAPLPPPHHRWGAPAALYAYHDAQGLIGYVARFEPEGERKQFAPYRWLEGKWQAKALPKPRPLYRTERLLERPEAVAVVCEGEKAAEAAAALFPKYVAVSWAGGAQAIDTADWQTLARRKVVLWPDADLPGREAMGKLAAKLAELGCDVHVINPDDQADGWDAADALAAGWDSKRTAAWARPRLVQYAAPAPLSDIAASPPDGSPSLSPPAPMTTAGAGAPPSTDPPVDLHDRQLWEWYGLETRYGNGTPPANEDTVVRILGHKAADFWFDDFLQRAMTTWGGTKPRPVEDADLADLLIWIQRTVKLPKMAQGTVERGLQVILYRNRRNCAQEWLRSLQWDGTPRLALLLSHGFGCEPSEYHAQVGANFLKGMVHRVLEPGCQMDYVPIFEGGQGVGKSSALRVIGGEWFTECHEALTSKDFYQILPGKMLLEFAELHAMSKAEAEKVKGVISNRVDTYRASYGRRAGDYPRMCVFAGTTNRDDWNKDDTGARRFWRVKVGSIDLDWLRQWREQLIAEAVHRVNAGEDHYRVPMDEARRLQQEAMEGDGWEAAVVSYADRMGEVRPEDVLKDALSLPIEKWDKAAMGRVRSILRVHGFKNKTARRHGRFVKVWRKPSIADSPEMPPPPSSDTDDDDDIPEL